MRTAAVILQHAGPQGGPGMAWHAASHVLSSVIGALGSTLIGLSAMLVKGFGSRMADER
jgi:hypothetical protein